MTANKTNPIANMAQALTGNKTPAKSKTPKAVSLTDLEILDLVGDSAKDVLNYAKANDEQVKALESLNKHIACLHNGGVRFEDGRKKDKATAVAKKALFDSLTGKSNNYKQDIWELFFKAVNTGKALTTLNKTRNAKGGKGQKSKGGSDDSAKMTGALLNVWKLSDVAGEALTTIESSMDNGMTLIEAIEDYLKLQGEDLTTESAE